MQGIGRWLVKLLPGRSPGVNVELLHLAFNVVQHAEQLQRFFGNLALVIGVQLVELAAGMRHAASFHHALPEQRLVRYIIITDQRTAPVAKEVAGMAASARFGEVEHHCLHTAHAGAAITPQVGPMRLAIARLEHGHWRFVSMQDGLCQQFLTECIDQWLQLHTAHADPLSQRRIRDGQSGTAEDAALPVQRQVVLIFGDQYMGQQGCRRNALVNDLRRHRRLHQRLALPAGPFAADVALHRKDAGLVIELLRHVLADALQLAAATAGGGIRFVAYFLARQRGRQRGALGLLLTIVLGRPGRRELLDLGAQGFDVGVEGLKQHALLLATIGFAGSGELEPLEDGQLVRKLVDQCLLATHLRHEPGGQFAQLLGVEVVQVWRGGHHGTTSCHSRNRFTTAAPSVG